MVCFGITMRLSSSLSLFFSYTFNWLVSLSLSLDVLSLCHTLEFKTLNSQTLHFMGPMNRMWPNFVRRNIHQTSKHLENQFEMNQISVTIYMWILTGAVSDDDFFFLFLERDFFYNLRLILVAFCDYIKLPENLEIHNVKSDGFYAFTSVCYSKNRPKYYVSVDQKQFETRPGYFVYAHRMPSYV